MKRIQTSGVIAVCLGMLACGDSGTSTPDGNGTGSGGGSANNAEPMDGNVVDPDGDDPSDNANGTAKPAADGAVDEPLACDGVGVCDDNFKDTCDDTPDNCPTTQAAGIDEPSWDCAGDPPANVYAYATFPQGTTVPGANLAAGACVAFFEGAKDLFYAKWFKFGPKMVTDQCATYDGCICPKGTLFNQSYDRRLYAFTWDGDDECQHIRIVDHQGGTVETALNQPVSNNCRKYLYALHTEGDTAISDGQGAYDLPFSYVAGGLPALKRRLSDFPKVEVACMEVQTAGPLPWAQLMVSDVKTNPGFKKKN